MRIAAGDDAILKMAGARPPGPAAAGRAGPPGGGRRSNEEGRVTHGLRVGSRALRARDRLS